MWLRNTVVGTFGSGGNCVTRVTRIALIGLPGSGKSSVGHVLAAELGCVLVDLDELIEQRTGMTIPKIFAQFGEPGFRTSELEALTSLRDSTAQLVVATGGGVVVTPACRQQLQREFYPVYLRATLATLKQRLATERDGRPLLSGEEPLETRLKRLFAERQEHYRSTAAMIVDVDGLTPPELAAAIRSQLPK